MYATNAKRNWILTVLRFTFVKCESTERANKVTFQVLSGSNHPMLCLLECLCTPTNRATCCKKWYHALIHNTQDVNAELHDFSAVCLSGITGETSWSTLTEYWSDALHAMPPITDNETLFVWHSPLLNGDHRNMEKMLSQRKDITRSLPIAGLC